MKIVADLDLCQGHAACEMEAPDVFVVPKHGQVEVAAESPPEALRSEVQDAVRFCPTQALRILED